MIGPKRDDAANNTYTHTNCFISVRRAQHIYYYVTLMAIHNHRSVVYVHIELSHIIKSGPGAHSLKIFPSQCVCIRLTSPAGWKEEESLHNTLLLLLKLIYLVGKGRRLKYYFEFFFLFLWLRYKFRLSGSDAIPHCEKDWQHHKRLSLYLSELRTEWLLGEQENKLRLLLLGPSKH